MELLFYVLGILILSENVHGATTKRFPFGTIEGVDLQSETSRRPVQAYYGVPYAEPPVGPLRFKPPVAFKGRGGPSAVISSTSLRASCVQDVPMATPMSEDCLHLNVFVPAVAATAQAARKVMVWIHGGGYVAGNALTYIPTDLVADYDVIVVTLHYRLAFLGFLSTGDAAVPGNNGLRDAVMALHWVKDNIGAFGGDSNDVTIFGESAGGGVVSFLSLSPYAKGLFTKAIMQSGTANSPWTSMPVSRVKEAFYQMAERLGCRPWFHTLFTTSSENSHNRIIECLRGKPAEDIKHVANGTGRFADMTMYLFASVVVDGDFVPRDPVFLLQDLDYLRENGVSNRSYISGTNNNEAYPLLEGLIPGEFSQHATEDNLRSLSEDFAKHYMPLGVNDEVLNVIDFMYTYPRGDTNKPTYQNFADIVSDSIYVYPNLEFVRLLTQTSPQTDVFLYFFDNQPDQLDQNAPKYGTGHGFDLLYLWDHQAFDPFLSGKVDMTTLRSKQMKRIHSGSFSSFAKTGVPRFETNVGQQISWPRFDAADRKYMAVSTTPEVRQHLLAQRMSLWGDFLPKIATNLFTGQRSHLG